MPDDSTRQSAVAAATPRHGNRLAIASFALALVPLVAWGLRAIHIDVLFSVLYPVISSIAPPMNAYGAPVAFYRASLAAYAAYGLCGIAGVVIGGLALGRAGRYPPHLARRGFAIAGMVLGILGILAFACVVFGAYFGLQLM